MSKEEIKAMHKEAKELLEDEKSLSDWGKRVARNCFKKKWWGIEPEEALKIGA